MSHDTVVLKWNKPKFGAQDVKHYTVTYCAGEDHDFPDKWKTKTTAGLQETVTVTGLHETDLLSIASKCVLNVMLVVAPTVKAVILFNYMLHQHLVNLGSPLLLTMIPFTTAFY